MQQFLFSTFYFPIENYFSIFPFRPSFVPYHAAYEQSICIEFGTHCFNYSKDRYTSSGLKSEYWDIGMYFMRRVPSCGAKRLVSQPTSHWGSSWASTALLEEPTGDPMGSTRIGACASLPLDVWMSFEKHCSRFSMAPKSRQLCVAQSLQSETSIMHYVPFKWSRWEVASRRVLPSVCAFNPAKSQAS